MNKAADAFRTISEVAEELDVPKHVLRFWEARFPQIKPMKRGGGRRYYRPADLELLRGIRHLLHNEGYTIKGVQKILREQGVDAVKGRSQANGQAKDTHVEPVIGDARAKAGRRVPSARARNATGSESVDFEAAVKAIIVELQTCRDLLAGRMIEAEGQAPKAARGRARARK